jgi:hypothetical protein
LAPFEGSDGDGGGGTLVLTSTRAPLLIAGGGAGAGGSQDGGDGLIPGNGGGGSGGAGGYRGGGGGGGSLNNAFANIVAISGAHSGNGELDIDFVGPAVPEPSTCAMLLLGFAGLGALAYHRNRSASRPAKA